jgi:Terpene cyclase DEP1
MWSARVPGEIRLDGPTAVYELRIPMHEAAHAANPQTALPDHIRFADGHRTRSSCQNRTARIIRGRVPYLSGMRAKTAYLLLAVLGALVPYMHFFPWLREHGLDLPLFLRQLRANQVSEFFAADVIVSAGVVLIFLFFERRRLGSFWWIPVIALVIFGVSAALPLLLCLRERSRTA